ncbi:phenylacetate--CoA ligase [Roseiconus nitratireducens]|uniref:Phenylacetate--CoA ligase n=1 Tax=Roseiconus nitratireducens TaxID=2605748 RepID=A0A5M6D0M9_9BACT|nr:phenylacetate--CoA ligase [Roseiconus nitratireducens]KAA5540994.1 phenylacetate--CoA ligase [Roseiconus nitratireducens]
MNGPTSELIQHQWQLDHEAVRRIQLDRLNQLLAVAGENAFYQPRLANVRLPLESLDQLSEIPLLRKSDLVPDQPGLPGRVFALPRSSYVRYHQTSGTSGHPMPVYDTPDDWQWWLDCWEHVLHAAEVTPEDVVMMAFSFGPFIGFWTANDAAVRRGAMVIPGGGLSSEARLQMIADQHCTALCCTPTYALHLIAVASELGLDLRATAVTRLIVAGEPGGSVPEIRQRIEDGWDARVIDHSGASELGAWGFGSADRRGLHVIETEFIAERLRFDDDTPNGVPAADGEEAELVLTGLGRFGGPAIRYRTGDIVRGFREHRHACRFLYLDGGVLGRSDDMMVVRGVNVFPSSVESIVRSVDPTAEFRMIVTKRGAMDALAIEAELSPAGCETLRDRFQQRLALRVNVQPVAQGTLPRFEGKARRLDDRRGASSDRDEPAAKPESSRPE